jgi:CubicO group peptidase (beta-lactamase class C family)
MSPPDKQVAVPTVIGGACDERFHPVRAALAENFEADDEWGASLAVFVDGHKVIDLWGGHVDQARSKPWQRDTLVNAYSVGKGILSLLAVGCVETGELSLDAKVASLWPEFGTHGKGDLTVRSLLAHRSGLPGVRRLLPAEAKYDWSRMCDELAGQEPFWQPGSDHGYHVNTQGFLVGEVLRRATGIPVGELLQQRIALPLGVDYFFGLPTGLHDRASGVFAPDVAVDTPERWAMAFPATGDAEHDEMIWRSYFNPSGISGLGCVNTKEWREAVIPSTNGHGNARAVATIYSAYLDGNVNGRNWVGPGLRSEAATPHSQGVDRVLGKPSCFGLGLQLAQPSRPIGPNPGSFGHFGYGGSLGMADPESGLAFAYITNHPGQRWQTTRTTRVLDCVYACL